MVGKAITFSRACTRLSACKTRAVQGCDRILQVKRASNLLGSSNARTCSRRSSLKQVMRDRSLDLKCQNPCHPALEPGGKARTWHAGASSVRRAAGTARLVNCPLGCNAAALRLQWSFLPIRHSGGDNLPGFRKTRGTSAAGNDLAEVVPMGGPRFHVNLSPFKEARTPPINRKPAWKSSVNCCSNSSRSSSRIRSRRGSSVPSDGIPRLVP